MEFEELKEELNKECNISMIKSVSVRCRASFYSDAIKIIDNAINNKNIFIDTNINNDNEVNDLLCRSLDDITEHLLFIKHNNYDFYFLILLLYNNLISIIVPSNDVTYKLNLLSILLDNNITMRDQIEINRLLLSKIVELIKMPIDYNLSPISDRYKNAYKDYLTDSEKYNFQ